jgi:hypothetical protein
VTHVWTFEDLMMASEKFHEKVTREAEAARHAQEARR